MFSAHTQTTRLIDRPSVQAIADPSGKEAAEARTIGFEAYAGTHIKEIVGEEQVAEMIKPGTSNSDEEAKRGKLANFVSGIVAGGTGEAEATEGEEPVAEEEPTVEETQPEEPEV